ncbi:MAG: hypothetical protein JEZ02_03475 [Desulfatibacillum sp.]|nr:hypothetical protein [Desulfatibacillum sp.]
MENLLNPAYSNSSPWAKLLKYAAYFLTIASALRSFSLVMADPDLWGHLKFGQALVENGGLHATDPYSFTAFGHLWINHEWLTELLFWLTYDNLGDAGLLMGKLLIGLGLAALLFYASRNQPPVAIALIVSLAVFVVSPGFNVRPQVFSFLFFGVFVVVLREFFSGRKNLLFILPLATILWVQLHGGFLMGVVVLGLAAGWETLMQWVTGKKNFSIKNLWFWTILTFAAPLVNPYGYKLLVFFVQTLSIPRPISEWEPLFLTDFSHWQGKALMLLFLGAIVTKSKKIRHWETVCILFTMYAAMRHVRHLPFFAIIAAPWLVDWAGEVAADLKKKFPNVVITSLTLGILVMAFATAGIFQSYKLVRIYQNTNMRILVDPNYYPVQAVRYLKANNVKGNLILPFDWGEFALWHLYPNMQISIDGRFRTSYPESVIQDHFIAFAYPGHWNRLEKYPGDILLAPNTRFFRKVANENGPWKIFHADDTAILFLRDNAFNKEVFARFKNPGFVRPQLDDFIYFP